MLKLRRWLIRLCLVFAMVLVLLFVAGKYWGKDIIPHVLTEVNNQLKAPVKVHEVDFTLIERFPYASVKLNQVYIPDTARGDTLLFAENIYLDFNILSWFSGDWAIKKIAVKGSQLSVVEDKNGHFNAEIWKAQESNTSDTKLRIETLELEAYKLKFFSERNGFSYSNKGVQLQLSFEEKSSGGINIDAEGNALTANNEEWLVNLPVKLDGKWSFDSETKSFVLYADELILPDATLSGIWNYTSDVTGFEIKGKLANPNVIKSCIAPLLPEWILNQNLQGTVLVNGGYKIGEGQTSGSIDLALRNSAYRWKEKLDVDIATAEIIIATSLNGGTSVKIKEAKVSSGQSDLSLQGQISTLNQGSAQFFADGVLDLTSLKTVSAESDSWAGKIGAAVKVNVSDFKNITSKNWQRVVKIEGSLNMLNAQWKGKEQAVILSGKAQLESNVISLSEMKVQQNEHLFVVDGTVKNWTYFMDQPAKVFANLKVVSDKYSLAEASGNKEESLPLELDKIIHYIPSGNYDVGLKLLEWNGFDINELQAKVEHSWQDQATVSLVAKKWKGTHEWAGRFVHLKNKKQYAVRGVLESKNMQLPPLVDFFSEELAPHITAKNIEGVWNSTTNFFIPFNYAGSIDFPELQVRSAYEIRNAETHNLAVLNDVKAYLKQNLLADAVIHKNNLVARLTDIDWDNWKGSIEISNGKVYIPNTSLKSQDFNLNVSGTHTLDGDMDYHLSFSLSELFRNDNQNEYGYIQDDGDGLKLYLFISGNSKDMQIGFDKAQAQTTRKEKWNQEKETIKTIFKKDSPEKEESEGTTRFEIEKEEESKTKPESTGAKEEKKKKGKFGKFLDKVLESGEELDSKESTKFSLEEDE